MFEASTAEEAMDIIKTKAESLSLVITDRTLSQNGAPEEVNDFGFEVVSAVAKINDRISVIMASATYHELIIRNALVAGANDFLKLPCSMDGFLDAVKRRLPKAV